MNEKPQRTTITLERSYRTPNERVFSELPILSRLLDGAPIERCLIYGEADSRKGGRDVFRCGPKRRPEVSGTDIVSTPFSRTSVWFQPRPSTRMADVL